MDEADMIDDNSLCNVTIEIDSDDEKKPSNIIGKAPGFLGTLKFGPQYTLGQMVFNVSSHLLIGDLTTTAKEMLSAHLNIKAFGSMKNWEYIACEYGMSSDAIMMMQRDISPFDLLSKKYSHENLNNFIRLLKRMNRVDTLYSLKELFDVGQLCDGSYSRNQTISDDSPRLRIPNQFVLVVHYETTGEERKEYRWLLKNLKNNQRRHVVRPIIDIAQYISEENIVSSLQTLFNEALQIVVCYTPSFVRLHEVASSSDMFINLNLNIIRMMEAEFFQRNCINLRFRPVIFENLESIRIPMGWATSTIQYKFPSMGGTLLKRLFDDENL